MTIGYAAWLALPLLAAAAMAADQGSDVATIVNSGSTNTRGYMIQVSRAGTATVDAHDGDATRQANVEPELASRLFGALDAAKPLDALASRHCMKSVSFGYSIRIRYGGVSSPDLTCAGDDRSQQLAALASEVAQAVGLSDHAPRRPVPAP
jgi:hypothetical protein